MKANHLSLRLASEKLKVERTIMSSRFDQVYKDMERGEKKKWKILKRSTDKEGYLTVPPQPGSKKLRFVVHIKV